MFNTLKLERKRIALSGQMNRSRLRMVALEQIQLGKP